MSRFPMYFVPMVVYLILRLSAEAPAEARLAIHIRSKEIIATISTQNTERYLDTTDMQQDHATLQLSFRQYNKGTMQHYYRLLVRVPGRIRILDQRCSRSACAEQCATRITTAYQLLRTTTEQVYYKEADIIKAREFWSLLYDVFVRLPIVYHAMMCISSSCSFNNWTSVILHSIIL